jgi:hypothetical protein
VRNALFLLSALPLFSSAPELARQIRENGFDPRECYRVRDLEIVRGEARIFLNEGLVIFQRPVAGRIVAAAFSGDVEGGGGEILLIPPARSERASLASFIRSPNLAERFRTAVFLFTDGTAGELREKIRESPVAKNAPEAGVLLASRWDSVLGNLSRSFEVRLVEDILAGRRDAAGLFFAAIVGEKLGNFDLLYDPNLRQQLMLGQVANRGGHAFYDVWTSFAARDFRLGRREWKPRTVTVSQYRLNAALEPDLRLRVETRLAVELEESAAVLPFEISPRMRVESATVDGQPADVFAPESTRANLARGDGNQTFLIVPPAPLGPGSHELVVQHAGEVITHAGNQVYFVGSRINWYPLSGLQFSQYEMEFRYPKHLSLVTSGVPVEERVEGEWKITRSRSGGRLRYAGFNLGNYLRESAEKGPYRVDVYANRNLEAELQPKTVVIAAPPPAGLPRRRPPFADIAPATPILLPAPARVATGSMARAIAEEFEWMASILGPPPQPALSVSPIPGIFGQGFPGLLYLSTRAYLEPPGGFGAAPQQAYFSELLHAHETAHQWWGNSVVSPGYEDDWIQEAMANYLALMALERRRGARTMDKVLEECKQRLLAKDADGRTVESAGPVTFGLRLQNSRNFAAWRAIVYDKGAWIIHMLRRRLGDALFREMLAETARRYRERPLDTGALRAIAAEFLARQPAGASSYRSVDPKLENFFDTWTAGTGIPAYTLKWSVRGAAPKFAVTVTVTQSGVGDDFMDAVPVEIHTGRGSPLVRWLRTSSEPATITQTLALRPTRVLLDPGNATLKQ